MTTLIIGASGLVGSHCLTLLLADPRVSKVTALVRKSLGIQHEKLSEIIVDFDNLDKCSSDIKADVVISTLGTTLGKAGSSAAFTKVDYEYQLKVAEIAKRNGVKGFILLSSGGANKSSLILYIKVKGEVEAAISALGFEKLVIFRPSVLLGERKESRPTEAIAQWFSKNMSFLWKGPLAAYKGVEAETVAKAIVNAVQKPYSGIRFVENLEIWDWAKK